MNIALRATTILSLTSLFACRSLEPREARLAGCYSVEVGSFSPSGLILPSQKPPGMVRLDTARKDFLLARDAEHRTIADIVDAGDFFFSRDAAWTLQGDTLSLVWSSAFTGAEIRVSTRGSRMHGRIHFFSDQIGTTMPMAPVTFTRRACS